MSAMHNFMALVCVDLGCSSPTLWPDIWGRWGEAYTVRKLLGLMNISLYRRMTGRILGKRGTKGCDRYELSPYFSVVRS